jgi:glycine/sarcosine/betaine reductase complex component A
MSGMLEDKNIIILGDRDGIPGGAIEKCLEGKKLNIIFSATECFV